MYAYKDILELAGLTTRLYTLLATLHNVPSPKHVEGKQGENEIVLEHVDVCLPEGSGSGNGNGDSFSGGEDGRYAHGHGHEHELVKDLSFALKEGDHLMITGSNGVGKTAVARVLAGLWNVRGVDAEVRTIGDEFEGDEGKREKRRKRKGMFVVPQRSYMVTGSLLDQVIYPDSYAEYVEGGRTEEELRMILESAWLGYLPEREGGWYARKEWRDVLSGGEKQRVGPSLFLWNGSSDWYCSVE
jgi:ATP-binding cassette subfamily D (ALD) long-chain fatty acid import protein